MTISRIFQDDAVLYRGAAQCDGHVFETVLSRAPCTTDKNIKTITPAKQILFNTIP